VSFPLSSSDPGETEFGHGKGLRSSPTQNANRSEAMQPAWPFDRAPEGPWGLSVYDQGKAVQRTDPAEPNAVADMTAKPYTPGNRTGTQWVRES
jgi:hypothetical protein